VAAREAAAGAAAAAAAARSVSPSEIAPVVTEAAPQSEVSPPAQEQPAPNEGGGTATAAVGTAAPESTSQMGGLDVAC